MQLNQANCLHHMKLRDGPISAGLDRPLLMVARRPCRASHPSRTLDLYYILLVCILVLWVDYVVANNTSIPACGGSSSCFSLPLWTETFGFTYTAVSIANNSYRMVVDTGGWASGLLSGSALVNAGTQKQFCQPLLTQSVAQLNLPPPLTCSDPACPGNASSTDQCANPASPCQLQQSFIGGASFDGTFYNATVSPIAGARDVGTFSAEIVLQIFTISEISTASPLTVVPYLDGLLGLDIPGMLSNGRFNTSMLGGLLASSPSTSKVLSFVLPSNRSTSPGSSDGSTGLLQIGGLPSFVDSQGLRGNITWFPQRQDLSYISAGKVVSIAVGQNSVTINSNQSFVALLDTGLPMVLFPSVLFSQFQNTVSAFCELANIPGVSFSICVSILTGTLPFSSHSAMRFLPNVTFTLGSENTDTLLTLSVPPSAYLVPGICGANSVFPPSPSAAFYNDSGDSVASSSLILGWPVLAGRLIAVDYQNSSSQVVGILPDPVDPSLISQTSPASCGGQTQRIGGETTARPAFVNLETDHSAAFITQSMSRVLYSGVATCPTNNGGSSPSSAGSDETRNLILESAIPVGATVVGAVSALLFKKRKRSSDNNQTKSVQEGSIKTTEQPTHRNATIKTKGHESYVETKNAFREEIELQSRPSVTGMESRAAPSVSRDTANVV